MILAVSAVVCCVTGCGKNRSPVPKEHGLGDLDIAETPAATVQVVVAGRSLTNSQQLQRWDLALKSCAVSQVTTNYIKSSDYGDALGKVITQDLPAGQPILRTLLSE